ncbi:3'-5' exonuclease [uncultured Flavobacterium sp.]|uniref:3'-5' exonuclease n=1 Tax=uncultured Flavobacterium sp. TaxID=165435 RepID=UPI0030EE63EE
MDTETTGLLKPDLTAIEFQPFMTELCMIKFDKNFEVIAKYNSLFKIPIPVPEIITKITGITDEALEDQPTFSEELKKISNFMTGVNHVIGHNVNFDMDVLKFELRRIRTLFSLAH